jgi:hypothetical protein
MNMRFALRMLEANREMVKQTTQWLEANTLWTKAKEIVIRDTGTLTLEGVKIALATLMRHLLVG